MDELTNFFGESSLDGFKRYPEPPKWADMKKLAYGDIPQIFLYVERHGEDEERIRGIVETRNFNGRIALIGFGPEHCFEVGGHMDRQVIFPVRLSKYDEKTLRGLLVVRITPDDFGYSGVTTLQA